MVFTWWRSPSTGTTLRTLVLSTTFKSGGWAAEYRFKYLKWNPNSIHGDETKTEYDSHRRDLHLIFNDETKPSLCSYTLRKNWRSSKISGDKIVTVFHVNNIAPQRSLTAKAKTGLASFLKQAGCAWKGINHQSSNSSLVEKFHTNAQKVKENSV